MITDARDRSGAPQHRDSVDFVDVRKQFGDTVALARLNLHVEAGEFIAIVGPSGCGKTTMLRLLAGLEQPDSGEVRMGGRSMTGVKPWHRKAPMVWQSHALFPFMSVQRNVEFALKPLKVPKADRAGRVRDSLQRLGIEELAHRRVDQLSGGQRQRVAIARALVQEPGILLLDEPLSALDAHLRVRMQSELRQMHRALGITFFYVTHYQSEALSMADRIVVMDHGRIAQVGSPEDIYRRPRNRFVAEFVGANNVMSGVVEEVSAQQVAVGTASGRHVVPTTGGVDSTSGAHVDFAIGADCAYLGTRGTAAEQSVEAVMRGSEYVGGTVTHHLELVDGSMFRIDLTAAAARSTTPDLGSRVTVSWSAADAVLLESEPA